jgi:hypothetical protein
MSNSIVPFREQQAEPENQSIPERAVTPPWTAIRRQLYRLLEEDTSEDRAFSKDTAAIIFGPQSLGPSQSLPYNDGILYITGNEKRYLQRAKREFNAFHLAYYGANRQAEPDSPFTAEELRMYRIMFCWERARKTFNAEPKNNFRKKRKSL